MVRIMEIRIIEVLLYFNVVWPKFVAIIHLPSVKILPM